MKPKSTDSSLAKRVQIIYILLVLGTAISCFCTGFYLEASIAALIAGLISFYAFWLNRERQILKLINETDDFKMYDLTSKSKISLSEIFDSLIDKEDTDGIRKFCFPSIHKITEIAKKNVDHICDGNNRYKTALALFIENDHYSVAYFNFSKNQKGENEIITRHYNLKSPFWAYEQHVRVLVPIKIA